MSNPFLDIPFMFLLTGKNTRKYNINLKELYDSLDSLKIQYIGSTSDFERFILLRKHLKDYGISLRLHVTYPRYSHVEFEAEYLYDDEQIILYFGIDCETLGITEKVNTKRWNNIRFQLVEVLAHEIIHHFQYKTKMFNPEKLNTWPFIRNPNLLNEVEYLFDPCEVHAYAHTIMMELSRGKTSPALKRYVKVYERVKKRYNSEIAVLKRSYINLKDNIEYWAACYGRTIEEERYTDHGYAP